VKLEIIWITIPTLAVAVICVATIMTMRTATAATTRPPDLIVRGHQWWWEVEYPKAGVITANEIHLPTGQKWLVQLDADDVIHDFWVPELARKIDMIPGVHRQIWLEADQPGVYEGECAEFCGAEHAWMRFQVIAQPPAEYAQWLAQQQQPRPAPASAEAMQGHALFSQMTCAACHAVEQTPNSVRIAPNLTHLASRQKLAAGVLENTPDHLFQWLKDPQKFKPGCRMPNLKLTDAQTRALVAYLEGTP
jgi:cytochrome c oxidase subunit 2